MPSSARPSLPASLRLLPADRHAAARAGLFAIIAVTLFVVALDLVFWSALPDEYRQFYTTPLAPRTWKACLGALKEEFLFRLLLTRLLAALPALWGKRASAGWMIGSIVLAQLVNVHEVAFILPPWGVLRFWLVGCVWGWLYWKYGFATALIAHGTVHLLLDPALLLVLA